MLDVIYPTNLQELQSWIVSNEKMRPDVVRNKHPVIYSIILQNTTNLPDSVTLRQRYFHILNPATNIKCPVCNLPTKWNENNREYREYCSTKCMSNSKTIREKVKQTNLIKYNGIAPACSIAVTNKIKKTKLDNFGFESYNNRTQAKQTCIEKYGVDNPTKAADIANKVRQAILATHADRGQLIRSQTKQTCTERYGVDNPIKVEEFNTKRKNTNLERYGVENAFQNPDIQQKQKQTNADRYGAEHVWSLCKVRDQIKKTNTDRYGTPVASQKHMIDILPLLQDYDWLYDQYITQQKTATQLAYELGIDGTTVCNYLREAEIEIKYNTSFSYKSIVWLEATMEAEGIHIQHALNEGEYQIPGTRWKADGYCEATNTIYEFHGDYWHGNPLVYEPTHVNTSNGEYMGHLYQKTLEREEAIKALGYNLVVVWETTE